MTKIGMFLACTLFACGGAGADDAREPEQMTASPEAADPTTETAPEATPSDETPAEPVDDTAVTSETPVTGDETNLDATAVAAATTPEPARMAAIAELKSIKDETAVGTLTFERDADGKIVISGQFTGLKPGEHALYIHEVGDCSNKGKNAGGHLNPTKAKHGPPASAERHAGDFGNLTADDAGNATFAMTTDSLTMEVDRADSLLGRAVIVHDKKDDLKGKVKAPFACGVITEGR